MVDNIIENEFVPSHVSPPGDTLAEVLEDRSMPQAELASRTGRTKKHINQIIKGIAAITPETAIQLERVLGIPASFWNNRQCRFDEFRARQKEEEIVSSNLQWSRFFPYNEMAKRGWVEQTRDKASRLRNLLNFLAIAAPAQWDARWQATAFKLRASQTFSPDKYALAAWLRKGELIGRKSVCQPYSEERFRNCLSEIRAMTSDPPSIFQSKLEALCASCGIAVAFVKELPKTASGATRWLAPDKALLQLSLRYKTNDHLWFTFFHEAGHILLHKRKRDIFIESRKYEDKEEVEADRFAADMLISPIDFEELVNAPKYSRSFVTSFARRIGIAPGIVVGRLQNADLIPHSHLYDLKEKLYWSDE